MNDEMRISAAGLDHVAKWEGCVLKPYQDVAGLWTIGVGHLIKPTDSFSTISNAQVKELLKSKDKNHPVAKISIPRDEAMSILAIDVKECEDAIKRNIKVKLNQNQFDALCSFGFNCGVGVYSKSGVATAVNEGRFSDVPTRLEEWSKATINGVKQTVKGLLDRRRDEGRLFVTPMSSATSSVQKQDETIPWSSTILTEAQGHLKKLGLYALKVDGLWGPGTSKAISDFAAANGRPLTNPSTGIPTSLLTLLRTTASGK